MKILQVEVYKNAIKVKVYINAQQTFEEVIKIRWWQRKSALSVINNFFIDNLIIFYNSGVKWQLNKVTALKYNFKTKQLE